VVTVRDVHKVPLLDIVGWFTLTPESGPSPAILPIHSQIIQEYNESAVLLAFHPSQIASDSESGAKLPLTVYESVFEGENVADARSAAQTGDDRQALHVRFRELPYSIETGEAEMISIDFVARGAGNAMAIEETSKPAPKARVTKASVAEESKKADESVLLSPENEECKFHDLNVTRSSIYLTLSIYQSLPISQPVSTPSRHLNLAYASSDHSSKTYHHPRRTVKPVRAHSQYSATYPH
jgi:COP9 signalosome complex subunit 6